MRRASRVDGPHAAIVAAFRAMGLSAHSTAMVSNGFPDICISNGPQTALVEVKDGQKPLSKQKLTEDQEKFHAHWKGRIFLCRSIVEVPGIVESLK